MRSSEKSNAKSKRRAKWKYKHDSTTLALAAIWENGFERLREDKRLVRSHTPNLDENSGSQFRLYWR